MAEKGGYAAARLQQLVVQEANLAVELEDLGVFASELQAEISGFVASGHGLLSVISTVL